MQNPITDAEINAFLDKRMNELEQRDFLDRLKQDQSAQERLAIYKQNQNLLEQAYQPIFNQEIPSHLLPQQKRSPYRYSH